MLFKKTSINSAGQQFIQVSEPVWEDGMKVADKVGFIEIKPEVADRKVKELQEGKLLATFGGFNTTTQLYTIQVVKAEAVAEGAANTLTTEA